MAQKGLGMGLGSLFGDAAIEDNENDFTYLPVSKVEPRPDQPRSVFDEEGLNELAESIREHGIRQPLTVRELEGGFYQIIAGERRWRAARMAGISEVPARIIEADDKKAMELALVENLQREGLNPVEEALGYKSLIEEYGLTQDEAAKMVSKSRPVVTNALRILSLPNEVIGLIEIGELSAGAARAILSLDGEEKQIKAAKTVVEKKLSVRETEKLVKELNGEKRPKKLKKDALDIYYREAEKNLTANLSRRVRILNSGKKGKIEIEYYDGDDFERIYSALCGARYLEEER